MQLPFLKASKRPRVARPEDGKLPEEKVINGSESDEVESKCFMEMQEAMKNKDAGALRSAIEALVMNMFQGEPDAAQSR